ncbi:hypothetical protein [Phenylobacterium sp.]|jgi:hypothetical protein|uniref:hypothetical protein n=1 Tax=Phenylobacterium sp. TaxID=1871053 RepID=UPI003784A3D7
MRTLILSTALTLALAPAVQAQIIRNPSAQEAARDTAEAVAPAPAKITPDGKTVTVNGKKVKAKVKPGAASNPIEPPQALDSAAANVPAPKRAEQSTRGMTGVAN